MLYRILQLTPVLFLSLLISCTSNKQQEEDPEEDSVQVKEETREEPSEWITLFNGETLDGWKRYNADDIGDIWKVEDGVIVCYSEGGGEATSSGGSLITVEQFDNFELSLEFKLSPNGNSGILYHVVEDPEYSHAYETGPEYQLLDDGGASDLKAAQMTAANYDMYAPAENKVLNPVGEWNTVKIIYNEGHVEHWLNGRKVLEFEEGSEDWNERYNNSKWTDYPGWCKYEKGSVGLQDHGNYTWFRNIKIRKL